MLDPFSRGAIIVLSGLCIAGVCALTPLGARSSIEAARPSTSKFVSTTTSPTVAILAIRRDPFAEPVDRDDAAPPAAARPQRVRSGTTQSFGSNGAIGRLPSNLADDAIPSIPGTSSDRSVANTRITAIVTGAHPYALLETNGVNDIKGLGDRVNGIPIVAIDIAGIRLDDGERLSVAPGPRP